MTGQDWLRFAAWVWIGFIGFFAVRGLVRHSTRQTWLWMLQGADVTLAAIITGLAIGLVLPK